MRESPACSVLAITEVCFTFIMPISNAVSRLRAVILLEHPYFLRSKHTEGGMFLDVLFMDMYLPTRGRVGAQ